ncbi:MAG: hypothetical protein LBS31_06350, partial [Candidatus Adiutrix sp.]|nr:hypothetical protein [Candidatus Adiutrix sp.]
EEAAMLPGGITDERPKALIVYDDEETTNTLIEKLETIGYQSTVAINVRDAAKQIKFTKFEVLLLQEDYYGSNLAGNQLLRAVQALDTHRRRGMLVVLISPTMVTLDDLLAFCLSIDAVVNIEDLHTIDRILLSTVGRAKKFYDAYQEMLASCGLE